MMGLVGKAGKVFKTVPVLLPPVHGRFGAVRKHDIHTGIDLYAPVGTPVFAVRKGTVVAIEDFTGPKAGSPWWLDTQAVMIEDKTHVLLYGEIETNLEVGMKIEEGQFVGLVKRVLRNDKGLPTSMLHFEAYAWGTRKSVVWELDSPRPPSLYNPQIHIIFDDNFR